MKKYCPECKTENEEQFNFCKNCGTALDFTKEKLLNFTRRGLDCGGFPV